MRPELLSFVVDASILAAWFLDEKSESTRRSGVRHGGPRRDGRSESPLLSDSQRASHERAAKNRITEAMSAAFLRDLALLPIRLEPPGNDASLVALARNRKLTVYDAAYLELAKREALPLATFDRDLETAALTEGVALFGA
jgi:predicted nucleic acid-binding protein